MEKKKKTEDFVVDPDFSGFEEEDEAEEEAEDIDLSDALLRMGFQLVCFEDGKIRLVRADQLRDIS